tara:strand:- start:36 stop:662 length:627 start_codon:yes stop_codon:yes gene_type:complete
MTFGLVKHNNNSLSAVTSVGLTQGKITLIKEQTASSSASISFVDGSGGVVLDSTYPIYMFEFINIHPSNDGAKFNFNMSIDGGSNYNVTKTSSNLETYHYENDSQSVFNATSGGTLQQGTGDLAVLRGVGSDNDQCGCATMHLFSPSNTTFMKHFQIRSVRSQSIDYAGDNLFCGYGNTTSAIDAIIFRMSAGDIDSGTIKLFGIKGS